MLLIGIGIANDALRDFQIGSWVVRKLVVAGCWDAARKVWHRTLTGTEAINGEVAWLKETIYGGRTIKLEFEVRDALLRYSKRRGKKVVKDV